MVRKDCDMRNARVRAVVFAMIIAGTTQLARAGQLKLWSSAVVVADSIRLGDLVEFREMDSLESDQLRNIFITEAPPQGGSRIIHHEMIRAALSQKGVNLARISLKGAAQCEVRRPAALQPANDQANVSDGAPNVNGPDNSNASPLHVHGGSAPNATGGGQSLRAAIEAHFQGEFERFGGKVEVLFDRKDDGVLELTGPPLKFEIRPEEKAILGLTAVEVQLVREGLPPQTVRMVVRTALSRNVVTARRAINQGATVVAADVELLPVTFTHLDDTGIDDISAVLGQRAKKFIAAGASVNPDYLEPVPLVLRGQLITLVSEVGGVRIVTTAKAGNAGRRGEIIRVRCLDDNKAELDAVVTAPGEARALGAAEPRGDSKPRLALGGGS